MKTAINKISKSKYFVHYIFWTVLLVQYSIDNWYLARKSIPIYIICFILKNVLLMGIVYTNLLVLIPRFFKQKKYLLYFFSVFIIGLLYTACTIILIEQYLIGDIKDWVLECSIQGRVTVDFLVGMRYFVISFLFYLIQQRYEQQQQLTNILLEKTKSDLNYLRSQINPHFLFNTFNNLYGLAIEKSDKTPEVILKLSDMMDYMLYESNELEVLLKKDIENLQNYMVIELLRQKNTDAISFTVEGKVGKQKIAPLLFLPLLENGFKHGVSNSIENGFLESQLIVDNKNITFKMKNNVSKATSNNKALNRGIGLTNLHKRLDLTYPNRYCFETKIKDGYFFTFLQLNLSV